MADYCAWDHKDWTAAGLKSYEDFADGIEYVNQREDYCDSLRGDWYYADDETRTIYYGSHGNDHSPGASSYTYADTFPDDEDGYRAAVAKWAALPEYLESDDDEEDDDDSECDDDEEGAEVGEEAAE